MMPRTIFPRKPMVPLPTTPPDNEVGEDDVDVGDDPAGPSPDPGEIKVMIEVEGMSEKRSKYGIAEYKKTILTSIADHQLTIIRAPCGHGKSTQVPQYILDEARDKNAHVRIIVITPWRPSAITSSAWIAHERGEVVGQTVGYQTHLESRYSPTDTILTYCSPKSFLRSVSPPVLKFLRNTTHFILDEVHERSSEYELVMAIVRDLLHFQTKKKVIIMSSFFDVKFFAKYFTGNVTSTCNTIDIPNTFTNVVLRHGHEVIEEVEYTMKNIIPPKNVLNYHLIIHILKIAHSGNPIPSQSILVFLPGYEEIIKLWRMIENESELGGSIIQMLHEETAPEEINHSITTTKPERRSILLATQVAETSIIVNDIFLVIDTGIALFKRNTLDPEIQFTKYQWISKASAVQRIGRISQHVQVGFVYRLYELKQYMYNFEEYNTPGILSEPLEEAVLRLIPLLTYIKGEDEYPYPKPKTADIRPKISKFFSQLPHTPTKVELLRAIESLVSTGALARNARMSQLGKTFLDIPMEPHFSKMLILSAIFKCLDPVLTTVSLMITGDPFNFEGDTLFTEEVRKKKRNFVFNTFSDHVALVMCFQEWEKMRAHGSEYQFCREYCLRPSVFESTYVIRTQSLAHLRSIGLVRHSGAGNVDDLNSNSSNWPLVRAIILAGLNKNLVYLNKTACKFEFEDRKDITIDPTSVNYTSDVKNLRNHPSEWLVFDEYVMDGKQMLIKGISYVNPIAVALFGNGFWEKPKVTRTSETETYLATTHRTNMSYRTNRKFLIDKNLITWITSLRKDLRNLIIHRVTSPTSTNPNKHDPLIRKFADFLLCAEGAAGKFSRHDFGATPLYTAGNMLSAPNTGFEHPYPYSTPTCV